MNHRSKGDVLTCFFITSNNNKFYWNIEFLQLNGTSIIEHKDFTPIRKEMAVIVVDFKIDINSEKTKVLICGQIDSYDFCFYYDISQTDIIYDYKYPENGICSDQYVKLKVDYFQENDEFVFSCVDINENIKYVIYKFDNSDNLIYNSYSLQNENECEKFNGYRFYYSSEVNK